VTAGGTDETPLAGPTVVPSPPTVISRHPIRSGNDRSANVSGVVAVSEVGSAARNVHTSRIVGRPPAPGGNERPAAVSRSGSGGPPARRSRSGASSVQAGPRSAAASAGSIVPSPFGSIRRTSWKAGISARSSTKSTRTASRLTRIPAK
jgi:hypothetical protein